MDFRIPEELEILRITLRKFFQNEVEPLIGEIEKNDEVPEELIKKVVELGYCGLNIPEEYGGQEMGILAQCLAYEEFSPHMGFLMRISPALTCEAIVGDGTEEQKKKYLPDIAKGKIVTAIAITEPNAGSDIGAITTSAIRDGDNFILNGRKHFISNGDIADLVMVMVLTDKKLGIRGRITATLVDKGTPGFSVGRIQETMGLAGSHQSELLFEDCAVSAKNVVGKEGDGYRLIMKYLDRGRLYTGVAALGIAEKALRLSIEYSNQRVRHEAAQEMRVGPSEPACRSWLQTTLSCNGKEPLW